MVGMMAVGMGLQAVGGLFGGRARKKAAKREAARMAALGNQAMAALDTDQARAIEYRTSDEARLKAATGIDMVKLVADAEAAGFNPLTVLNATGGAGYDGRGAVLTTPFIGKADGFFQQMSSSAAAGQGVVQSSGYVGDTMAGFGQNLFQVGSMATQRNHEIAMQAASFRDAASARSAIYGGSAPRGQNGRTAPMVGANIATGPMRVAGADNPKNQWTTNPDGTINIPFSTGGSSNYDPRYVEQMGWERNVPIKPDDPGDGFNQIMGVLGAAETWFGGTQFNQWLQRNEPSRRANAQQRRQHPPVAPKPVWRAPAGNPRGN